MDREEQVGLRLIRDRRPRLQRNKRVVRPRINHLRAQPLVQQLAQPQRHIQHNVLLLDAAHAHRARVVPAMPRIDHDAPDLQPQRPHQRSLPIRRRHRSPRRKRRRNLGPSASSAKTAEMPTRSPMIPTPGSFTTAEIGCEVGLRVASTLPG